MVAVDEVSDIIRTYARDEDAFQDAWVEILDKRAESKEEITRIAKNYRWGILRIGNDIRGDTILRKDKGTTLFDMLVVQSEDGDETTKRIVDNLMQVQQRRIKGGRNHSVEKNYDTHSLFHMKAPQSHFELAHKLRQENYTIQKISDYLLNVSGHRYSSATIYVWLRNPRKLEEPLLSMDITKIPEENRTPTFTRPHTEEEKLKISMSVRKWYRLRKR